MDTRTTRAPGRLRREWIDIPATFKAEGFSWKGSGPWVPRRMDKLRAYGNSIVVQAAEAVIRAAM